ncbi:MAG: hypothetical protein M3Y50_17765 [Acidobacteriota bacterium]|nr:hypothetical protein [Acidobacteriota bacterium]
MKNDGNTERNPSANPQVSPAGSELERGKIAGTSVPGTEDVNKVQSIGGPFASFLHPAAVDPAVASGTLLSGVAQPHTSGILSGEMTHARESAAHGIGLAAGMETPSGPQEGGLSIGSPRTLAATPAALEVGIQSGAHGWVKVRAEVGEAGAVNASISSGSAVGQEMLHRDLPSITAFLQAEKVHVGTVEIYTPVPLAANDSSFGTTADASQEHRGHDGGEQTQQNSGRPASGTVSQGAAYASVPGTADDGLHAAVSHSLDGCWLSVRV